MRAWIKRAYRETDLGFALLRPFARARDWLEAEGWRSDRDAIGRRFEKTFGRPLEWGRPRTLNEKLNWMKLNVRDPLQKIAADKFAVRAHVAARAGAGYLVPLLAKYDRAGDVRFADLPRSFVLKTNHGSGQNWIVRDQSKEDERRVVRQFREWMASNHYAASREWPYKGMKPAIVAEELLLDEEGRIPSDFKFHCFGGKAAAVQVDLDRDADHRRNFYDMDWRPLPFVWTEWEGDRPSWPNGRAVGRPAGLEEMAGLAEKLAADFPYARIDLFYCGGKVYFGEITFYHGGGFERFDPPEQDLRFGEMLALPV